MDGRDWQATIHGVTNETDTTSRLNTTTLVYSIGSLLFNPVFQIYRLNIRHHPLTRRTGKNCSVAPKVNLELSNFSTFSYLSRLGKLDRVGSHVNSFLCYYISMKNVRKTLLQVILCALSITDSHNTK